MKRFILFSILAVFVSVQAQAVKIQEVTSPKLGIKAWLVESSQLPMVNMEINFRAGSYFDEESKGGTAALTAALLREGSGGLDASAFAQELERLGARFGASADVLNTSVKLRMLSDNKEKSLELLKSALQTPHFSEEAFTRVQDVTLAGLKIAKQNSNAVAGNLLKEYLYPNHGYGKPSEGTMKSVSSLTVEDVQAFHEKYYNTANMKVSVVGDMTAVELGEYLDVLFADFPVGEAEVSIKSGAQGFMPLTVRQTMPVPQSTIYLAHPGINRQDPDYYAAYAMNYVLGGGGFNSRLMEEIREKRGLAYSVFSYFEMLPHQGGFIVSVNTKNKDAQTSIDLIKQQMQRIKTNGVGEGEYNGAMAYLKGSFPLRLDSSSKILGYLSVMQMENLGIDYLDKWQRRVEAVTREDMQRVAKRLLDENSMVTVIVGGDQ